MMYIYFNRTKKNAGHNGITCVGYEYNEEDKELSMGFAFCCPGDNFSKVGTHQRILGRFAKGKKVIFADMQERPKYEVVAELAKNIMNNSLPAGGQPVKDFVKEHHFKEFPSVGGVNLPWWFQGV